MTCFLCLFSCLFNLTATDNVHQGWNCSENSMCCQAEADVKISRVPDQNGISKACYMVEFQFQLKMAS